MSAIGPAAEDSEAKTQAENFEFMAKVDRGEITQALQAIWTNGKREQANAWFGYMLKFITASQWLTYLTDPNIDECQELFSNEQLQRLMSYAQSQQAHYSEDDPDLTVLHNLMLTIAKNRYFCKSLGYAYFIKFVASNPLLADHITTHGPFLINLDYSLMVRLAKLLPNRVEIILDTISNVITIEPSLINWATHAIMGIFLIQNEKSIPLNNGPTSAHELIFKLSKYNGYLNFLRTEFASDKQFAFEVLHYPVFCKLWSVSGEMCAHRHSQLTDRDFTNLAAYFRLSHPEISNEYLSFCRDATMVAEVAKESKEKPEAKRKQRTAKFDINDDVEIDFDELDYTAVIGFVDAKSQTPRDDLADLTFEPTFTPILDTLSALDISAASNREALFDETVPQRPTTPAFGRPQQ